MLNDGNIQLKAVKELRQKSINMISNIGELLIWQTSKKELLQYLTMTLVSCLEKIKGIILLKIVPKSSPNIVGKIENLHYKASWLGRLNSNASFFTLLINSFV
ncbi:MAG: hypothetical protein QXJ17_02675 [Nitrososphaeria archaeon]